MEYMLEGEERSSWRSFFSVIVRSVMFVIAVGLMQSWDATWLPVVIGLPTFVYLRGQRYEALVNGDVTNRVVEFRPYDRGFGKFVFGAVAVGAFISNVAWPSLAGILLWGLVLLLVADKWRGWSEGYGERPASVASLLVVMGVCQWVSPWLLWTLVGLLIGGYLIGKALDGGSQDSLTVVGTGALTRWCDQFGVLSVSLVALFAVGINVAFPSISGVLAWLVFVGFAIFRWRDGQGVGLRGGSGKTPVKTVTPEEAAIMRFGPDVLHQAGLTVKSPATGLPMPPQVGAAKLDRLGRPAFAARMIPGHQTLDTWVKAGPKIASAWGVLRVIVEQGASATTGEPIPGTVWVTGIAREFVRTEPVPWFPNRYALDEGVNVTDYLSRLQMGEMGDSTEPWFLSLKEANLVVGGVPGAGKSVFLNGLLAHLSVHPHVEIGFIDLKAGVEAGAWEERLSATAYEQSDAVDLIEWLLADCRERYKRMRTAKVRNAWTSPGYLGAEEPVRVLVIDEAAELFAGASAASRKLADQAADSLRSLVSLGRAAGYVVIMATQKPTVDTLPSSIRDLATVRIAFRCTRPAGSVAIIGDDVIDAGDELAPHKIAEKQRGVAISTTSTGGLVKVQCALIEEEAIDRVVASRWSSNLWAYNGEPGIEETRTPDTAAPVRVDDGELTLVSGLDDLVEEDEPMPWKPTTPPPPLPSLSKEPE